MADLLDLPTNADAVDPDEDRAADEDDNPLGVARLVVASVRDETHAVPKDRLAAWRSKIQSTGHSSTSRCPAPGETGGAA